MRLEERCLHDLPRGTIFVGSSTDMFAETIPKKWINRVLSHIIDYPNTLFYFESKNPERYIDFFEVRHTSDKIWLGTTIETNRENGEYAVSMAPSIGKRVFHWLDVLSMEPIMDFDLEELVSIIRFINPKFVSIGADSQRHNLPEPSPEKLRSLIYQLRGLTEVKLKSNLRRLLDDISVNQSLDN